MDECGCGSGPGHRKLMTRSARGGREPEKSKRRQEPQVLVPARGEKQSPEPAALTGRTRTLRTLHSARTDIPCSNNSRTVVRGVDLFGGPVPHAGRWERTALCAVTRPSDGEDDGASRSNWQAFLSSFPLFRARRAECRPEMR